MYIHTYMHTYIYIYICVYSRVLFSSWTQVSRNQPRNVYASCDTGIRFGFEGLFFRAICCSQVSVVGRHGRRGKAKLVLSVLGCLEGRQK